MIDNNFTIRNLKLLNNSHGQSIIEIIIAMGIFVLIASAIITLILGSHNIMEQAGEQTQAEALAQQGIEAVRFVKNNNWDSLTCVNCIATVSGGEWTLNTGANQVIDQYLRTITLSDVYRDSNDDISVSGVLDPYTKLAEVVVTWTIRQGVTNSVQRTEYLTNWWYDDATLACDWSNISMASSINLSGNQDGNKLQLLDNYIYYVRNSGTPEFAIIDISDLENPSLVGSLTLSGAPSNIVVSGNYAYISSSSNSQELQIIDISIPASPVQVGSFNAVGSANANGLDIIGGTVYLVRSSSWYGDELIIIDVTSKTSPNLLGSLNLSATANEIVVSGDYAYIASDNNSQELQIVDISVPSDITITGSYNFAGNQNAETIDFINNTLVIARNDGTTYLMDITTPTTPSILGSYDAQANVNDLVVDVSNNLYLGTDYSSGNLQVVDITDATTPILEGLYDSDSNINGLAVSSDECAIFTALSSNSQEFIIFVPTLPDTTPPATITDLALSGATNNSINLNWTAPGDDGNVDVATSYDLRYSTSLITTTNWASATPVIGEPIPSVAGSLESMTVSGLSTSTTYYFAIKTSDEIPNESDLSNVPNITTASSLPITIFYETFPNADRAWNGSADTAQDEPGWSTIQGNGDTNDIQISNEDIGIASPSGGNHLTFEDCDQGFYTPETYDIAYTAIDLSGYTSVNIEYYWQSDDVDNTEGMRIAYSTDSTNGINGTWIQIAEYLNPTDNTWTTESFNLPDISAVSTFKLRFSSKSNRGNEHMYVDDIKIVGY